MSDLLFIVITVIFFVVSAWFIRGYNALYEEESNA